jgi:hypothetical protein
MHQRQRFHTQSRINLTPDQWNFNVQASHNHWEIDYRKIIGIYRNFDGQLLHSYFTTVSEVFLELLTPLRGFQTEFGR